jgi:hypothetical protein
MSNYSGFSSASVLELQRMASKMARMEAMMIANGLTPDVSATPTSFSQPAQGTSAQARMSSNSGNLKANLTPSRKRHSSQQLGGAPKDLRVSGANRFEILTQRNSYDDKSMRPDSIKSTPGPSARPTIRPHSSTQLRTAPSGSTLVELNAGETFKDDNLIVGEGVFDIHNNRAFRQEIEVALETLNGEEFRGTVTPQEAKFTVFRDCLGFPDFTNFDGVRLSYKAGPALVFKLKTAINVDELIGIQYFKFQRKSTRQGRLYMDTVGCKIRGLRVPSMNADNQQMSSGTNRKNRPDQDDGTRTVRIEGCEYRIPKETLIRVLSFYGTVITDVVEVMFADGGDPDIAENGSNRTGTYAAKVRLTKKIPQLLPVLGKRIRISYPGVQRLCTNCFGSHGRQSCQSKKMKWNQYVTRFKEQNPDFPVALERFTGTSESELLTDRSANALDLQHHQKNQANPEAPFMITSDCTVASDTAKWVDKTSGEVHDLTTLDQTTLMITSRDTSVIDTIAKACSTDQNEPKEPKESDYKIPNSKEEYDKIVNDLMSVGSTKSEAEQLIGMRRTAFNRATREFKKSTNKSANKSNIKKSSKNSKLTSQLTDEYGN